MSASFRLSGAEAMRAKLKRIAVKFPDKVAAALFVEANVELTESKRRTPVDMGTLRASGLVAQPVRSGRNISVTLAYGGAAETYAIIVHEDLSAFHKIGQAKFLESTLNESRPHMASRVAKRIKLTEIDA